MALCANIRHREYGGSGKLALNREIVMLGIRELVPVVVAEFGHREVLGKVQVGVCRASDYREGEREALTLRLARRTSDKRGVELRRGGAGPVKSERRIADDGEIAE